MGGTRCGWDPGWGSHKSAPLAPPIRPSYSELQTESIQPNQSSIAG